LSDPPSAWGECEPDREERLAGIMTLRPEVVWDISYCRGCVANAAERKEAIGLGGVYRDLARYCFYLLYEKGTENDYE